MNSKKSSAKTKAETLEECAHSSETPKGRAAIAATPDVNSALVVTSFSLWGDQDFTTLISEIRRSTEKAKNGDLESLEQMLASQAIALDTLFARLAAHARPNLSQFPTAMELYMRLALRAQNQCRTTIETLAAIKNPPVLFAKQAYVAGGHQQVNNNGQPETVARVDSQIRQNKLLEHQDERLDFGTTRETGEGNPGVETLEAINRTHQSGRKGEGGTKRLARRKTSESEGVGQGNAPTA